MYQSQVSKLCHLRKLNALDESQLIYLMTLGEAEEHQSFGYALQRPEE